MLQNAPKHSAILSTFIKLLIVICILVLCIFEWPIHTDFTVHVLKLFSVLIGTCSLIMLNTVLQEVCSGSVVEC